MLFKKIKVRDILSFRIEIISQKKGERNMPEIQKYNLKEKLNEANEKYKGSPAVAGKSAMTFFRYNNSTRTQMLTSHLDQIINPIDPRFPFVFSGVENVVGKNSSGYYKAKSRFDVVKKVVKFEDLYPEGQEPYSYQLFVWDKDKHRYDVIEREEVKDLPQDYGYQKDNHVIDSLVEGDSIENGDILYKSTSYDDSMNYRFGRNLPVIYTLEPYTSEDAAIISEHASKALTTVHSKKIGWGWNINDIPLNLYGGNEEYRPLPWIGEMIEGYLASSRPQINEQLAYDFTHENLKKVRDGDRSILYPGKALFIDLDIYCNNDDIPDISFFKQIKIYLEAQTKYWQQIKDICLEIINSGKDYTSKVDLLYKKSEEFIDPNPKRKWNNGTSVFGNLEFRAHLIEYTPLAKGGKFTARYGNKSVVAKVVPDYQMPFTSDGRRVDVMLNLLAIINRTTAFVPHEMFITAILSQVRRYMKTLKTMDEKEALLFDVIKEFNKAYYEQEYAIYRKLNKKEKEEYIESAIEDGIFIHVDMVDEDESIFYKLIRIKNKYDFLKPDTLYYYKNNRINRINATYWLGDMYFFPLKQTDQRGFSVRNTGAINMKGLPERSYKNKRNEAAFSDTAIRFGEYEALNFLIGLSPEEYTCMEAFYRTSPEATSDLTKAQFVKKRTAQFKKYYKSRAAEIFTVLYRHLGLELEFNDEDNNILYNDDRAINEYVLDGYTHLCTQQEFYTMELRSRLRDSILKEKMVIDCDELEKLVDEVMTEGNTVTAPYDGRNIFGTYEKLED